VNRLAGTAITCAFAVDWSSHIRLRANVFAEKSVTRNPVPEKRRDHLLFSAPDERRPRRSLVSRESVVDVGMRTIVRKRARGSGAELGRNRATAARSVSQSARAAGRSAVLPAAATCATADRPAVRARARSGGSPSLSSCYPFECEAAVRAGRSAKPSADCMQSPASKRGGTASTPARRGLSVCRSITGHEKAPPAFWLAKYRFEGSNDPACHGLRGRLAGMDRCIRDAAGSCSRTT